MAPGFSSFRSLVPGYKITTNIHSSTRATSWGASAVVHVFQITFPTANDLNAFFDTGGDIRVDSSRTGGSATSQNTSWSNLLADSGTVIFNKWETTSTGSVGTVYPVSFSTITSAYQTIFEASPAGTYSSDIYRIRVLQSSTNVIDFRVVYSDGTDNVVDATVDGTLTNTISEKRSLNVPAPSYLTTSAL